MPAIPILETERLRMRGHTLADFDSSCAMWADPEVIRYLRPKPFTREEVWSRLLRHAGLWSLLGYGSWVVEEKQTGRFVGEVGFLNYQRDLQPPVDALPEIGWVLVPSVYGKGYATEAVRAAVVWGDKHFGAVRTSCIITPENAPSIRVASKCGYRELQTVTYKGEPLLLFVREP
jgi:RimJ/RimL family protein N-acetyltransferase